ncbi:MAG TPA: hypothetical protein VGX76_14695, partial [Pirellulales bacterium]|nr:hypothetical protein [Pirellulales bacterium]
AAADLCAATEQAAPRAVCPACGHHEGQTDESPSRCCRQPTDRCCCYANSAIPASRWKKMTGVTFVSAVSPAPDAPAVPKSSRPAVALPAPGRSLQILHCVWRC